jgi:hypothetical protein
MGQYFRVINKTKKELLNPHTFGSGLKIGEIISSRGEILQGLALLLAEGHIEYKDSIPKPSTIIGRWQGDKITILGDSAYDKEGNNIWDTMCDSKAELKKLWKDISSETYSVLLENSPIRDRKAKQIKKDGTKWMYSCEKALMEKLFPKECVEGDLRQKYDFVEKEQSEE